MAASGRGGYLLGRVSRAMGKAFEAIMREEGLADVGRGEGSVLYILWKSGPLRQSGLAAKAGVDKSTLALTLARMERKGWVVRQPDEADARAVTVELTTEATSRVPAFEMVSARMNALFYAGMGEDDIRRFETTLERILANLGE